MADNLPISSCQVDWKPMEHLLSRVLFAIAALSIVREAMPASMKQQWVEILCRIAAGESTNWTAKNLHQSSKFNREIWGSINTPASIFQLHQTIGAPEKATQNIVDYGEHLMRFNRSMSFVVITFGMSHSPGFPFVSPTTALNMRRELHDCLPTPGATFPVTDKHIADCLAFARFHCTDDTNSSRTIFKDENFSVLEHDHWTWSRRAETRPDVL
jgi:hypothetical protein